MGEQLGNPVGIFQQRLKMQIGELFFQLLAQQAENEVLNEAIAQLRGQLAEKQRPSEDAIDAAG
jgi:hypothetical protein